MGDRTRTEGTIDEVKGNVKEGVGKITGDEQTEREGQFDQVKGNVKQGVSDAADKLGDAVDNVRNR